jgi:hypothetical protein
VDLEFEPLESKMYVQTALASVLAYALMLALVHISEAVSMTLASAMPGLGGRAVFIGHTIIVAVAACVALALSARLFRQANPTAAALGVMALAVAAIALALVRSKGRVGIELGVWLFDLMPMALGLFFGCAITRDRRRAGIKAEQAATANRPLPPKW